MLMHCHSQRVCRSGGGPHATDRRDWHCRWEDGPSAQRKRHRTRAMGSVGPFGEGRNP